MTDPIQLVNALRRPKLLLEAVRHGLQDYRRDRLLRRLLGSAAAPGPRRAVAALVALEEDMEAARRGGEASYNAARHIEALVALISEARLVSSEAARAQRDQEADEPLRRVAAR